MKLKFTMDVTIAALEKNLADHIVEFKDATEVWTKDAIKALEQLRDAIDREGLKASQAEMWRVLNAMPQDNRPEYSRYLGMLRRAREGGETHVEIDEDEHDRIFNDNWNWRIASKARNSSYSSRK